MEIIILNLYQNISRIVEFGGIQEWWKYCWKSKSAEIQIAYNIFSKIFVDDCKTPHRPQKKTELKSYVVFPQVTPNIQEAGLENQPASFVSPFANK